MAVSAGQLLSVVVKNRGQPKSKSTQPTLVPIQSVSTDNSKNMGNGISAWDSALFGVTGASLGVALHYRNEGKVQRLRKNELAMELLKLRGSILENTSSTDYINNFRPRPSDVFVVTYPKSGTTWMAQICHMLRGGDMNFGEITEVCPWDARAEISGQDLNAEQVKDPRIFTSHSHYDKIAKGGRYIYVARNPEDVLVSFFHFLPGVRGLDQDDISLNQFADSIFIKGVGHFGTIWDHVMSWYMVKDYPNVLWVFFEDMKNDLKVQIQRVAAFLDIPTNVRDERVLQALEKSSFKFMSSKEHKHHFDGSFTVNKQKSAMGLPEESIIRVSKVRQGKTGMRSQIPSEILERLDGQWKQKITLKTDHVDYNSFHETFFK